MRIGNDNSGSSGQTVNYPIDRMRETAGNILSNANKSLAEHEATWAKVQRYIERFPGFMQGPVRTLFSLYEARLRASYQWQMDFAKTLADSADMAETTETDIANSFKQ
jgi:hypothetical protein